MHNRSPLPNSPPAKHKRWRRPKPSGLLLHKRARGPPPAPPPQPARPILPAPPSHNPTAGLPAPPAPPRSPAPSSLGLRVWTIQAFVPFDALPGTDAGGMAILGKAPGPGGSSDWGFYSSGANDLVFYYTTNGQVTGSVSQTSSDLGVLSTGVWYHAAAQRRGDDLELYFEGNRVLQSVGWFAGNKIFNGAASPVSIGRF